MAAILDGPATTARAWDVLDDEKLYEIIDGEKVETPPLSARATRVASDLAVALTVYGMANNIGKAYPEMLVQLPLPMDRRRRPDVIFVPFSRFPRDTEVPDTNEWAILPDVFIEVVSPSDFADEVETKKIEYFLAGGRQVWIVYPRHQTIYVQDSDGRVRRLTRADTLDGGEVLPGFRLPLAELFPAQS